MHIFGLLIVKEPRDIVSEDSDNTHTVYKWHGWTIRHGMTMKSIEFLSTSTTYKRRQYPIDKPKENGKV